jgi:ATP-dependent Clp protease ATP-binding subunit ClpX
VTLEISAAALAHIADLALQRKSGARGLRAVLEAALQPSMFSLPSQPWVRCCVLELLEDQAGARLQVLQSPAEEGVAVPSPAPSAPAERSAPAPRMTLDS